MTYDEALVCMGNGEVCKPDSGFSYRICDFHIERLNGWWQWPQWPISDEEKLQNWGCKPLTDKE